MNITLIGMAGSGKSYVGEKLAAALGYSFVDTDKTLESRLGAPLQEILDSVGEELFLKAEADEIVMLGDIADTVLAPGGSVVYSLRAVEFLTSHSRIVHIKALPDLIESRIDVTTRGIVGLSGKSFGDLEAERRALYEKVAEFTIDTKGKSGDEIVSAIMKELKLSLPKNTP
jgi:shikimate kinase